MSVGNDILHFLWFCVINITVVYARYLCAVTIGPLSGPSYISLQPYALTDVGHPFRKCQKARYKLPLTCTVTSAFLLLRHRSESSTLLFECRSKLTIMNAVLLHKFVFFFSVVLWYLACANYFLPG